MFVPLGLIESLTGAVVNADGCIGFRDSATKSITPLLWPPVTYISPDAQRVVLDNGSVAVDAPLTMLGARIQAKELWAETKGVAECAPDPEQAVVVVTGLPDIL
ncbi:MAG: hypothetical protein JWR01_1375, partial [Subtercola sp.]|nr:hypothetical protein [Subtercola sp.]